MKISFQLALVLISVAQPVAAELAIEVRDKSGVPAPFIDVRIECGRWNQHASTDVAGKASFMDIPAGRCTVHADLLDKPSYRQWRSETVVLEDEPRPRHLVLKLDVSHATLSMSGCCAVVLSEPTPREALRAQGLRCETWWPKTGLSEVPGPVLDVVLRPCRSELAAIPSDSLSSALWKALLRTDLADTLARRAVESWAALAEEQRLAIAEHLASGRAPEGAVGEELLALALNDEHESVRELLESALVESEG